MTAPSREEFLAARKAGVGGSDASSLFNIGWGCRRRLWLGKRSVEPDYPREETDAMSLGSYLESWFANKYAKITNRRVDVALQPFVHPTVPELRVNVDRIIFKPEEPTNAGVLEIKSQGRDVFFKTKREGLVEDYLLQLHHGMLVTGFTWGSFAIGNRDSGDLMHWDVQADPAIQSAILTEAPKFWALVENGPMPDALEPDDRRCQDCGYRLTCHGNALVSIDKASDYERDESLAGLVAEYVERRAAAKLADDLLDETKEEMKARLGDRGMVTAAGAKIQYYSFTKEAYTVPKHEERPLRIYPRKGR
jgi:predicted phage-related endonuclease